MNSTFVNSFSGGEPLEPLLSTETANLPPIQAEAPNSQEANNIQQEESKSYAESFTRPGTIRDEDISFRNRADLSVIEENKDNAEQANFISMSDLGVEDHSTAKLTLPLQSSSSTASSNSQRQNSRSPQGKKPFYKLTDQEKEIQRLKQECKDYPQGTRAQEDLALIYSKNKEYDESITWCEAALRVYWRSLRAYEYWAYALYQKGDKEGGKKKFKEALKKCTNRSAEIYNYWAFTLSKLGYYEKAIKKAKKAVEADPTYHLSYQNLGTWLGKQGKYDEANESFQKAVQLKPDFNKALQEWGIALSKQGKFEEAIEKFENSAAIDPKNAFVYTGWGLTLIKKGDYDAAITKFQKAISVSSDRTYVHPYNYWGVALTKQGKYEQAVAFYQIALALNPDEIDTYLKWGNTLDEQGKYEEAMEKYQTAMEKKLGKLKAGNRLGLLYYRIRAYEKASAMFHSVIPIQEGSVYISFQAFAHLNASLALRRLGNGIDADTNLNKGLNIAKKDVYIQNECIKGYEDEIEQVVKQRTHMEKYFNDLEKKVDYAKKNIGDVLPNILDALKNPKEHEQIEELLGDPHRGLLDVFKRVVDKMKRATNEFETELPTALDQARNEKNKALKELDDTVSEMREIIEQLKPKLSIQKNEPE